jgi:hypothetical protein
MLRLFFVAALTLTVAGAAWAGTACDKEKASTEKASVEKASSSSCSAHQTSAATAGTAAEPASAGKTCTAAEKAACDAKKTCTAAEKAACDAKKAGMAAAHEDCPFCNFMTEYKASHEKVTLSTVDTEDGVTVVFAAVSKDDVVAAQTMATKAFAMMNMVPHCEVAKAEMAEKSCDGCKKGLEAFSNTKVTLENTESGAQALVKVEKKEQIEKLRSFFAGLGQEEKTQG